MIRASQRRARALRRPRWLPLAAASGRNSSEALRTYTRLHLLKYLCLSSSSNSFTMLERSLGSLSHRGSTLLRSTYASTPPRRILACCRREYSLHPEQNVERLQELDSTQLQITKTATPKQLINPKDLVFGRAFTGKSCASISCPLFRAILKFTLQQELTEATRPHALHRMDRVHRLAYAPNNSLPKPLPRSCNLRLPLRLRVL